MKALYTVQNRKTRGIIARSYIHIALRNSQHSMYTSSDVKIARLLQVSRLTVFNIRREMKLKDRNARILDLLNQIDTTKLTIKELSVKLGIKYQNLYQLLRKHGLQTYPDKRPIDTMIEYQRNKMSIRKQ